nr:PIN domain-containing protein [Candidatus Baldrarchaeota archaeon]
MKNSSKVKTLILDANIWVHGILGTLKEATDIILKCIKGEYKILVNSYIVAEVTRVLKRIAIRIHRDPLELENCSGKY